MATAVQSRGEQPSSVVLSQSTVPTCEVDASRLRGILLVDLFNYKYPPKEVEQTISLAERAKKWQDLPKEQAIWVLKCIATALMVSLHVFNAIFLNFHWALTFTIGVLGGFAWHHILFAEGDDTITSEVFSITPDWEALDKERQELFQSYNYQMQNHIALLTHKIETEGF